MAFGDAEARTRFILENTSIMPVPHVPEMRLHLASEAHDLWQRTEDELQEIGLPPPFWAFAWAGGQGLARYLLDNPAVVNGQNVFDFAAGCGLVSIAAAMAGAASVTGNDVDPFSETAASLNCSLNGVTIHWQASNLLDDRSAMPQCDLFLCGDVFYDRELATALLPLLERLASSGTRVLVGDPGRSYLPRDRLHKLASYRVPVSRELEDSEIKLTNVWHFLPLSCA
ncbi:MAG: methyltransferase [Rhizobiaceae bacterium]